VFFEGHGVSQSYIFAFLLYNKNATCSFSIFFKKERAWWDVRDKILVEK